MNSREANRYFRHETKLNIHSSTLTESEHTHNIITGEKLGKMSGSPIPKGWEKRKDDKSHFDPGHIQWSFDGASGPQAHPPTQQYRIRDWEPINEPKKQAKLPEPFPRKTNVGDYGAAASAPFALTDADVKFVPIKKLVKESKSVERRKRAALAAWRKARLKYEEIPPRSQTSLGLVFEGNIDPRERIEPMPTDRSDRSDMSDILSTHRSYVSYASGFSTNRSIASTVDQLQGHGDTGLPSKWSTQSVAGTREGVAGNGIKPVKVMKPIKCPPKVSIYNHPNAILLGGRQGPPKHEQIGRFKSGLDEQVRVLAKERSTMKPLEPPSNNIFSGYTNDNEKFRQREQEHKREMYNTINRQVDELRRQHLDSRQSHRHDFFERISHL